MGPQPVDGDTKDACMAQPDQDPGSNAGGSPASGCFKLIRTQGVMLVGPQQVVCYSDLARDYAGECHSSQGVLMLMEVSAVRVTTRARDYDGGWSSSHGMWRHFQQTWLVAELVGKAVV